MVTGKPRTMLLNALKKVKLSAHAEEFLPYARPCVQFTYQQSTEKYGVGTSRVGGLPELPESVEWPEGCNEKGKAEGHAEFVAQLNFAELPVVEGLDLPRNGYLWLFVRNSKLIYKPAVVLFRNSEVELKRATELGTGYGGSKLRRGAGLTFRPGVSLPFSSKAFNRRFGEFSLSQLAEELASGMDSYGDMAGISGQIGGYSYQAEYDLAREFAMEELGRGDYWKVDHWNSIEDMEREIKHGNPFLARINPEADKERRKTLKRDLPKLEWIVENDEKIQRIADSFHLLCMFRPDMLVGLYFGDGMYLDFLVKGESLRKRDFSGVKAACLMLL
ncbi:MAG TPA: DUF1963 domain-containing protein [Phycisphaerae bacterium]|jgi:hypothetical protein|nr:DUF1963 domain-containing protein [Phycisphaerae bacterium]